MTQYKMKALIMHDHDLLNYVGQKATSVCSHIHVLGNLSSKTLLFYHIQTVTSIYLAQQFKYNTLNLVFNYRGTFMFSD